MKSLIQAVDAWLSGLGLERKLLALLGLCTLLVILVSAALVGWGVRLWYDYSVDRQFAQVGNALDDAMQRSQSDLQRLVNDLAADAGMAQRLDAIAGQSASAGREADFVWDQRAVVGRLARVGPTVRALVVAHDREGEPLGYFDGLHEQYSLAYFASPLLPTGELNRDVAVSALGGGGGEHQPLPRVVLQLPSGGDLPAWRNIAGRLALPAVAPVFVDTDGVRRRVGYVAAWSAQPVESLVQAAARQDFALQVLTRESGLVDEALAGHAWQAAPLPFTELGKEEAGRRLLGRFEQGGKFVRVFSLPSYEGGETLRLVLSLDKSGMRLRAVFAFFAAMLVPLAACLLAMLPVMRLARRHLVRPVLALASEIDAVRDGRYERSALPLLPVEHNEFDHLHRVLGELADELERREHDTWIWTSVFRRTREAIFITDLEGRVEYVNQAFIDVTGLAESQVVGQMASFISAALHDEDFYARLWSELAEEGHWAGEVWDQRSDGTSYPQWLSLTAIADREGHPTHYAGIFSDISERKAQEERINYLAHHDTLTGLPNRSMLMDRLRQALALADREGFQVGVLFIDLDRFKLINDTLGHSVGDGLLQTVAERLKRAVRAGDTVSRLGGDEFIVMLHKLRASEDAERVAEHILGVLAPTARVQGHELAITPSIGIAVYPEHGIDADEIIRSADVAMYHAKSQGRNNFQVFNPALSETAEESLSLEHALRSAADRDEFVLYYQPQIEVATRKLVGVEALIRWNSEEFGMVPPGKFIRIAEECGLILQMGDWILREACRQRAEWNVAGVDAFPIAVNVSALQFRQPEFVRRVEEAMQIYGVPAAQLELELTESIVMHESGATAAALQKLRDIGVAMAIDDFGTGYSSLGYLKHLPIQKLKIDGAFVRGIETDRADRAIVEAIISLGRALNLTLVAEGVEQRSAITVLGKLGCHVAQGYYYCRPLPPEDFIAWYAEFGGGARRLTAA